MIFASIAFLSRRRAAAMIGLIVALAIPLTGCRVVQTTAELPGKAVGVVTRSDKGPKFDPVEMQQNMLRLGDQFFTHVVIGVEDLRRGTNVLDDADILKWKIAMGTATTSMVSGPNAVANLLDMTVFVTVTRAALEQYWQPEVFGASAETMLSGCRSTETNLWQFLGRVLTPEQQAEFRAAITDWQRHNPSPKAVLAARAVGFASRLAEASHTGDAKPGSVFNLLMLDPLAGLDPATREIAETRLFAERALNVSQKLPLLFRWQSELLALNSVRMPEVQQVISNSTQLANAAQDFAHLANQLPTLVDQQRDAVIKQTFAGIATERTNLIASLAADEMKLRATLTDVRGALDSGTELAKASDATIQTLDTFMARFDKGTNAPAAPPATNSRPFDILDYAAAAKELTATFRELNTTLTSLDRAVPQIQKAGQMLEATGNRLVIRISIAGAALILLLGICLAVVAIVHRRTVTITAPGKQATSSRETPADPVSTIRGD